MRLYLASTSPARRALLAQSGIEPVLVAPGLDEDAAVAEAAAALGRDLTGPELVSMLAVAKASAVADGLVAGAPVDGVVFGGDSAFEVDGRLYGKPHDPAVARARWEEMLAVGGGTLWSGHCVIDRRVDRPGGPGAASAAAAPGAVLRDSGSVTDLGVGGPRTVVQPETRAASDRPGGTVRVDGTGGGTGAGASGAAPVPGSGTVPPGLVGDHPVAGRSSLHVDGDRVVAVDSAVLTFAEDMTVDEIDAYVATGEPLEVAGAFTIDGRAAAYISRIDGNPSAVVGLSLPVLRRMLLQGFGIRWHDLWAL